MDMKKILQALDTASTKPVEGSNDMKKFLSVVTEGANPHKVTLPVQMAMQHYAEPKVEKPKTIKEVKKTAMSGLLQQYYTEAQVEVEEEAVARKELISEQARVIAQRVLAKESFNPEYDDEAGMAHGSLHTLKRAVDGLMSTIDDKENLPEWCQEKISLAEDYLVTVWDYLQSEEAQGSDVAESRDKWDSNMPGHERYAGMGRRGREDDEYHNDGGIEEYTFRATIMDKDGNEMTKAPRVKTTKGRQHALNIAHQHYVNAGFSVVKIA
jgi:hypothetical protein